jgi:hypothetical protein
MKPLFYKGYRGGQYLQALAYALYRYIHEVEQRAQPLDERQGHGKGKGKVHLHGERRG